MHDIDTASLIIRLGIGITMLLFGLNQVQSPAKWLHYIPGLVRFIMPVQPTSFLRVHGAGNITLGLLLMSGLLQPLSIWLALAWWLFVTPFAAFYDWTVGMRDVAIASALVALLVLQS